MGNAMHGLSALVIVLGMAGTASAGEPSRPLRLAPAPPGATEAWNCYYYRGREHCSRYCYREVNGLRYCQDRAREAVPQGWFLLEEPQVAPDPAPARIPQRSWRRH